MKVFHEHKLLCKRPRNAEEPVRCLELVQRGVTDHDIGWGDFAKCKDVALLQCYGRLRNEALPCLPNLIVIDINAEKP